MIPLFEALSASFDQVPLIASSRNSTGERSPFVYGEPEDPHTIYMQEHLTKHTKDLLDPT